MSKKVKNTLRQVMSLAWQLVKRNDEINSIITIK